MLAVHSLDTVFTEQLPTSQALQNYVSIWQQNTAHSNMQTHMSEESTRSIWMNIKEIITRHLFYFIGEFVKFKKPATG
jgi:hypothetical protein